MKIKLNVELKGIDGVTSLPVPSKERNGKILTLKEVCINSILTPVQGDDEKKKFEKWELFKKIRDCKSNDIELKAEEIVIIKKSIGIIQPPLIMGQAFDLLEGMKK